MGFKDKVWSKVEKANKSKPVEKFWKGANKVGEASNKLVGKMGVEAFYPTDMDRECEKAARILRTFTRDSKNGSNPEVSDYNDLHAHKKVQKVLKKIPQKAIAGAQGIAIFTVFRTGFGLSGSSGSGIVVKRGVDGEWSPPCGILLHILGFGFLAGIDIYDCVILLRHQSAIDAFMKPQVKLGGELAVAAGPVGNGFTLDAGLDAKPAWSYTKSKGAYAGLQMDGSVFVIRTDENARFYHYPDVKAEWILNGRFPWPHTKGPQGLLNTLLLAEGKLEEVDMAFVPNGKSPSEAIDEPLSDDDAEAYAEKERLNAIVAARISAEENRNGTGTGIGNGDRDREGEGEETYYPPPEYLDEQFRSQEHTQLEEGHPHLQQSQQKPQQQQEQGQYQYHQAEEYPSYEQNPEQNPFAQPELHLEHPHTYRQDTGGVWTIKA